MLCGLDDRGATARELVGHGTHLDATRSQATPPKIGDVRRQWRLLAHRIRCPDPLVGITIQRVLDPIDGARALDRTVRRQRPGDLHPGGLIPDRCQLAPSVTRERRLARTRTPVDADRDRDRRDTGGDEADRAAAARGQRGQQLFDARVAGQRIGVEATRQHPVQPARYVGASRAGGRAFEALTHRPAKLLDRVAGEWPMAVEHFEQRDAERKDVALHAERRRSVEALRCHVRGRPEHLPAAGREDRGFIETTIGGCATDRLRPHVGDDLGEPEIADQRAPVGGEQHVIGLEIAVDDACLMGRRQSLAGLDERRDHLAPVVVLAHPLAQGRAVHILHDEEQLFAIAADVVNRRDVRVLEARHRLGLVAEPLNQALVSIADLSVLQRQPKPRIQELQRDLAIELGVMSGIHDPHPAGTDQAFDLVATDHGARREQPDHGCLQHRCGRSPVGGGRLGAEVRQRRPQDADDLAAARAIGDMHLDLDGLWLIELPKTITER